MLECMKQNKRNRITRVSLVTADRLEDRDWKNPGKPRIRPVPG